MNELLNTTFEVSLRVAIILSVSQHRLTLERITAYDFISSYGKDFLISDYNLHGNNRLRFSEYTVRREKVNQAIKYLVMRGYLLPHCGKAGFSYSLSEAGSEFCQSLNDDYATKYTAIVCESISRFANRKDAELTQQIRQLALNAFGGK